MNSLLDGDIAELRKKAALKLGELFALPGSIIPDREVIEQASSSLTAEYTASLINADDRIVDFTAGLGVNVFSFAKRAATVYAIERDSSRVAALEHNLELAGINNVKVYHSDSIKWLLENPRDFNIGFIDPSRRDSFGKIIRLRDCSPDPVSMIPLLKGVSRFFIKASPLLDISSAMRDIPFISNFHILEVNREVKELLIEVELNISHNHRIGLKCVRLKEDRHPEILSFCLDDKEKDCQLKYVGSKESIIPGMYLYEPSPSIMKSGLFGALAENFDGLLKLSKDTHLFISDQLYKGFPGRIFIIESLVGSSELKKLKGCHFNVISRNHPAKATEIESRYKLKPSENSFLVACTAGSQKTILQVTKLTNFSQ